eukprot:4305916-Prorocentrum_lima.AAC.1
MELCVLKERRSDTRWAAVWPTDVRSRVKWWQTLTHPEAWIGSEADRRVGRHAGRLPDQHTPRTRKRIS